MTTNWKPIVVKWNCTSIIVVHEHRHATRDDVVRVDVCDGEVAHLLGALVVAGCGDALGLTVRRVELVGAERNKCLTTDNQPTLLIRAP
ncbi:hypothetical protein [Longispora urticae]